MKLYRPQITIKIFHCSAAVYCYCQQYTCTATANSTIELYVGALFWGQSFHFIYKVVCLEWIFFFIKNDHLREWKPVLVEFQKSYYKVLEMQLQLTDLRFITI